jgi:hypothetical protein
MMLGTMSLGDDGGQMASGPSPSQRSHSLRRGLHGNVKLSLADEMGETLAELGLGAVAAAHLGPVEQDLANQRVRGRLDPKQVRVGDELWRPDDTPR